MVMPVIHYKGIVISRTGIIILKGTSPLRMFYDIMCGLNLLSCLFRPIVIQIVIADTIIYFSINHHSGFML